MANYQMVVFYSLYNSCWCEESNHIINHIWLSFTGLLWIICKCLKSFFLLENIFYFASLHFYFCLFTKIFQQNFHTLFKMIFDTCKQWGILYGMEKFGSKNSPNSTPFQTKTSAAYFTFAWAWHKYKRWCQRSLALDDFDFDTFF